jgi:hypothetical protein
MDYCIAMAPTREESFYQLLYMHQNLCFLPEILQAVVFPAIR